MNATHYLEKERILKFGIWKLYKKVNLLCLILLNHKLHKNRNA